MASDEKPGRTTGAAMTGLPANKRYITTHDSNGKSVYVGGSDQYFWTALDGSIGACHSYAVGQVPANMSDDADIEAYRADNDSELSHLSMGVALKQPGVTFKVIDLAPGCVSQFHRTVSIDFSICIIGEIDHELDSGEIVRLKPGDHIVQRATMHRWINVSKTEPARFAAAIVTSEPVKVGGKELGEEWQ